VFPVDAITSSWLQERANHIVKRGLAGVPSDQDGNGEHPRLNNNKIQNLVKNIPASDLDAYYAREIVIDLSTIQPHVSGPNSVKVKTSLAEIADKNIKVNKAYLVSCVNSRVEDLGEAARILRGKKIADHVQFYIAAASSEVQQESENNGDWQILLDAGATPLPPGCGPCIGLGTGLLEDGEVGISATNRNFKGRMGSSNADAYLASPAVVAASAIAGKITYPGEWNQNDPKASFKVNKSTSDGVSGSEDNFSQPQPEKFEVLKRFLDWIAKGSENKCLT